MAQKIPQESKSNIGLYLGALVILVLAEIGAILAINLFRPDKDNTALTTTVTMLMVPIITSFLNLINGHKASIKAEEASTKAEEAHKVSVETGKAINGRMDKALEDAKLGAYLKGKEEARAEAEKHFALLMATPPAIPPVILAPLTPPTAAIPLTKPPNG